MEEREREKEPSIHELFNQFHETHDEILMKEIMYGDQIVAIGLSSGQHCLEISRSAPLHLQYVNGQA